MAYLFTFMLTLLLINTPRRLRQFAGWLVGLAVFQALLATFLLFSGQYIFYKASGGGSAQGSFANRSQLAGFLQINLAIGIGLLFASMRSERSRNWREHLQNLAGTLLSSKIRLRIYLAIMVIALVLTHSRMGNTAFFASMTITGFLALALMKHSPRPLIILLASLIIIDIFIVSQWFGLEQLTQRFSDMQAEKVTLSIETNTLKRLDTTMHAKQLQDDARWTGTGAGTFFTIFSAYQGDNQKGYFQHAHNDYMEFLTDTGWVGLSILGAVIIITFLIALRAMRQRNHPLMRGMAFSSAMGIISLMIHSTTDFNFRIPSNAMLFMVILAFAYIASAMPVERK
jgi:O-antigen ligase